VSFRESTRSVRQTVASQPAPPAQTQQVPRCPKSLRSFLIFTLGAGGTLSLTSSSGLAGTAGAVALSFVSMYGISTVASQVNPLPSSPTNCLRMIRAIFVQGAIAQLCCASRCPGARQVARCLNSSTCVACCPAELASILLRLAILVAAFVFLVHVLRLLRRLEKPDCSVSTGGRNLQPSGRHEAQLDKLPLIYVLAASALSFTSGACTRSFGCSTLPGVSRPLLRHSFWLAGQPSCCSESVDAAGVARKHFGRRWLQLVFGASQDGSCALLRPPSQRPN